MSIQPRHGFIVPWFSVIAASILAWSLAVAPASAAGRTDTNSLDRISVAADPLTEAFGARPVMPLDVGHSSKWTDVLRRQESALVSPSPCQDESAEHCFKTFWNQTLAELRPLSRAEQVQRVNDIVNKMGYWSDWDVYRQADYWATPEEMFNQQGGDCEDFALFKYFLLRELGVAPEDMRMTLVAFNDQAHMVSLVMVDGAPVVLDCVELRTMPPEQLEQYQAVYSLSEKNWWLLAAADQPVAGQVAAR